MLGLGDIVIPGMFLCTFSKISKDLNAFFFEEEILQKTKQENSKQNLGSPFIHE
jgi:Signal peptide peptidase